MRLKRYLYVLRPLLAVRWVLRRDDPPPMVFAELAAQVLRAFIDRELAVASAAAPPRGDRRSGAELDAFLARSVLAQVSLNKSLLAAGA